MTEIYIDADACPVRDEIFSVATRRALTVHVVSNGSRPIRPPGLPNVHMVIVPAGADVADDWIADRITERDVCITADIPLAARCLAKGANALSYNVKRWTGDNIGSALAGREIARHMRETGLATGGPAPLNKQARSLFLQSLDAAIVAALRKPPAPSGVQHA